MWLPLYAVAVLATEPSDSGIACVADASTRRALRSANRASVQSGATWTCVLGRGDSVRVTVRVLQAHDENAAHESLELRRVRAPSPFQALPVDVEWGFAMLAKRGKGMRALDIDGDRYRDLLVESQMTRGPNRAAVVYLYDPRTSTLARAPQLSELMNVSPSTPGCVRHSKRTGPNEFVAGEYCRIESQWVETSRVETTTDPTTRRRFRRQYARAGSAMVLTKSDTLRAPR